MCAGVPNITRSRQNGQMVKKIMLLYVVVDCLLSFFRGINPTHKHNRSLKGAEAVVNVMITLSLC